MATRVHLHCLVTDGAFEERDAEVHFLPALGWGRGDTGRLRRSINCWRRLLDEARLGRALGGLIGARMHRWYDANRTHDYCNYLFVRS